MFESVFVEIALVLTLAAIAGALAQWLRQPLLAAFIAVGILLGPSGWHIVSHSQEIELFAQLGIALLLFVVGLKLDLHVIRTVGPVALASGLGQILFTSIIGYLLARLLGMAPIPALYVAVALTFSSTIIIVKLLSDKREVDALHGRIAVGFLIVQDIVVVLVMIALSVFTQAAGQLSLLHELLLILAKALAMLLLVAWLMRVLLPRLLKHLARSTELLMVFSIAWAVLGAVAGEQLGFSREVGAFLAGVSIASTPYREQVAARLVSLRDFLLLFFFIQLGASLDLHLMGAQLAEAVIFSLFVLIGNPLIVMLIMGYMGYRKRTGFLAGLTVAQISEFSLILAALGLSLGHLQPETLGLITLVGLVTISASTYMILYSHSLYERLAPWLTCFERRLPHRELDSPLAVEGAVDVLIIGLGRYGTALADNLLSQGARLLAVDFDPTAIKRHLGRGYGVHYGDAEDPEFVITLPLQQVRCIVSTVRDPAINRMLLHALRHNHYAGRIAIATSTPQDAAQFQKWGVDLILIPYVDAAKEAASRVLAGQSEQEDGGETLQ